MAIDFVSEVDRKFFANNLLSSDDWDSSMDISNVNFDLLPDDLVKDLSDDLVLPMDTDGLSFFSPNAHDDLLHDWSDSSDSGVSGLAAQIGVPSPEMTIKDEPLSPAFSIHSDSSDSLLQTPSITLSDPLIIESPHLMSHELVEVSTVPAGNTTQMFTFPIKQENQAPTTILVGGGTQSTVPIIHSIINSKVKIKPKPDPDSPTSSVSTTTTIPAKTAGINGTQKSLVLTAEEFARLTSQGVLRFKPPKKEGVDVTSLPVGTQPLQSQPSPGTIQPSYVTSLPVNNVQLPLNIENKDVRIIKRQQRMIKNRESASLSRRKKKEYLTTLEDQLQHCSMENQRLVNENHNLKRKVDELHNENQTLKKVFVSSPVKKTCLLAVVLLFSLNLVPWSGIMLSSKIAADTNAFNMPVVNKGRQLMAVQEGASSDSWGNLLKGDAINKLHDILFDYRDKEDNGTIPLYMCPTYFNRTESMRLAEQLAGWMYRHEEEKKREFKKSEKRQRKGKRVRPISTLRAAVRRGVNIVDQDKFRSTEGGYQLQVFGGEDSGRDFLKTIHRRNDTFYVLSFDTDYYLVPAVAHNKTMRPRMSLVMPAIALNESMTPPDGRIGMMQIDCEVMNTQLIHVKKSSLPKHYRDKNTTFTRFDEQNEKASFYP